MHTQPPKGAKETGRRVFWDLGTTISSYKIAPSNP
jgi:hypothetical protein